MHHLRTAARALGVVAVVAVAVALLGATSFRLLGARWTVPLLLADPPDLHVASSVPRSQPTTVVAADGSFLGRFRPEELHVSIEADEIPDVVRTAVLAAEDSRFYEHHGADIVATIRALVSNVRAGQIDQGGSTITQQLAKNLFTGADRTLGRKIAELRLALSLEERYSKDEILAAYLNTTYFGSSAIGIQAAAQTYFRKAAAELTLSEAALIAGIIPSPSAWNPRNAPEVAEEQRQRVLDAVEEDELAPATEVEAARRQRPTVHPARRADARYPFALDHVRRWLLDNEIVSPRDLHNGGLRIEATIVPQVQDAAIAAIHERLPLPTDPEAAVVVVDPAQDAVRALVGGRDWESSQVNFALGASGGGSGRQSGSAFKPFVLATALEDGVSLRDRFPAPREHTPDGADEPVGNYSNRGYGRVSLADATRRSINTTYVILTELLGPDRVVEMGRRLGLPLPEEAPGAAVGLGVLEVNPLAMAGAYGAFATEGRKVEPRPVQRVVRPGGEVVWEAPPPAGDDVLARDDALLVTEALRGVVRSGTGTAADFGRPAAGKTGTTDEYGDGWFAGYTPQLVAAVWVGFPEGSIPMRDVAGFRAISGGTVPALIWHDVMAAAHETLPVVDFPAAPDRPPSTTTTTRPPPPPTTRQRPPATTQAPRSTTTTQAPRSTTTTQPPSTTTTTTEPPPSTTTTTQPEEEPTTTTQPTTTTTEPEEERVPDEEDVPDEETAGAG